MLIPFQLRIYFLRMIKQKFHEVRLGELVYSYVTNRKCT